MIKTKNFITKIIEKGDLIYFKEKSDISKKKLEPIKMSICEIIKKPSK